MAGGIDVNVQYLWEPKGGKWWLVCALSRGTPAYHGGFAVGPYNAPREQHGQDIAAAILASVGDGEGAVADALAELPTLNSGPFPGVSPAEWFAGMPAMFRGELMDGLEAWASANALP